MIQRIQSLYLTFVIILCLLLFSGSILSFTDGIRKCSKAYQERKHLTRTEQVCWQQVANMWPLTAILILIALLSLITIFLFKNRKIQITADNIGYYNTVMQA